jgi:hypothetical protein
MTATTSRQALSTTLRRVRFAPGDLMPVAFTPQSSSRRSNLGTRRAGGRRLAPSNRVASSQVAKDAICCLSQHMSQTVE